MGGIHFARSFENENAIGSIAFADCEKRVSQNESCSFTSGTIEQSRNSV